jgi:hypothetical protein
MAFAATLIVEIQENLEDLLLLANSLPSAPAAVADGKKRLIQASRGALERAGRMHKIALIATKEGPDTAQRIFNPEPSYTGMNKEETKMLEKLGRRRRRRKRRTARRESLVGRAWPRRESHRFRDSRAAATVGTTAAGT